MARHIKHNYIALGIFDSSDRHRAKKGMFHNMPEFAIFLQIFKLQVT